MGANDEIFKEYVNMRKHGLDSREALRALRSYIDPLPQRAKEALAGQFRSWEHSQRPTQTPPQSQEKAPKPPSKPQAPTSQNQQKPVPIQSLPSKPQPIELPTTDELNEAIKRTSTQNRQQERPDDGLPDAVYGGNHYKWDAQAVEQQADEDVWVTCSYCGNKNRVRDVFCYSCGHMLDEVADHFDTHHFNSATSELFKDDFFGNDSVMLLSVRSGQVDGHFELRPQLHSREVVIGRSAENQTVRPDVDLAHLGAADLGVSRLHLSITYDRENESLQARDLGSANGTFINSQKLLPTEVRVLRSGDEVRIARLVLRVRFQHPGTRLD